MRVFALKRSCGRIPVDDPKPDSEINISMALALVGQLGLVVAVPIIAGALFGKQLDSWLHTTGVFFFTMLLIGLAAGGYGAYLLLAKDLKWKS
jgi:F0F1-type ATP synthase assembly protein I